MPKIEGWGLSKRKCRDQSQCSLSAQRSISHSECTHFQEGLIQPLCCFPQKQHMVVNTQTTYHMHGPIQHENRKGYLVLTPKHILPAPTYGPERIEVVFRPMYFKWQQVFYESRNYSIRDKNVWITDVTHLCSHFTEGAIFLKQL